MLQFAKEDEAINQTRKEAVVPRVKPLLLMLMYKETMWKNVLELIHFLP